MSIRDGGGPRYSLEPRSGRPATRFNPLKPTIVQIIYKDSVRASKRAPHFTITKINLLTLFKEIIAVYIETHKRPINTDCTLLICEAGGTYSGHSAFKG
jgi:hypothetical protein